MFYKLLATAALLSSTAASAEWQEGSSKHFVVYSDDSAEHVKAFTTKLETFDRAMKVFRGVAEDKRGPASRVTVYIVDGIADVQRLMPAGDQRKVAGFYQSRSTGPAAFVPRHAGGNGSNDLDALRILLHEYGHHFMYADWPSAAFPMWFSEGFAEFHSTAQFRSDGSVMFGAPPLDRGRGVTMMNQMPLDRMLKPNPGKMSDLDTFALYSRGWLLTHFLTFDPDRRAQLASYIVALNSGKPTEDAAKVFGNLNTLDIKLTSYARRPSFTTYTIAPSAMTIGGVKVRQLGAGEAATMPARIRSNAGVSAASAPQVASLASRLAAPFPRDAAAQNELAEAEFDAKDYAQAEAAVDRALAADPKSMHATLYKGMISEAVASAAKTNDPAQWQAVRRWYIAANKLDVEDPQPLILYYRSFRAAGQKPTKSAEAGLLYAYALAPYDLGLRLEAARIYLQQSNADAARDAMQPVAYSPHAGPLGPRIVAILTILNAGGPGAALAALDAETAKLEKEKAEKPRGA